MNDSAIRTGRGLRIHRRWAETGGQGLQLAHALVEAINQVAHVMSAKTVAGWTKSQAILGTLKEIGVDHAQGYAISKPRPLADLGKEQKLAASRSDSASPPNGEQGAC